MLWLIGPAGAGKSAIMQSVAELQDPSTILAALFFSAPHKRNDPKKVIATLAYQIAVRHEGYRSHIRSKLTADPTIWDKSITGQFSEFFVEPIVAKRAHIGPAQILIFIDGLDECEGEQEQIRFLGLISYFSFTFPDTPILWVVASRPEAHITSYLSRRRLVYTYEEEYVSIDSTEACQDVERFLRAELEKIRASDPVTSLMSYWPPENQFLKLAAAAKGLFAYATTATRFIGDAAESDPISQYDVILTLIEGTASVNSVEDTNEIQPMAKLDALYKHIISRVRTKDLPRVQEILSFVLYSRFSSCNRKAPMFMTCVFLGLEPHLLYRPPHLPAITLNPRFAFAINLPLTSPVIQEDRVSYSIPAPPSTKEIS